MPELRATTHFNDQCKPGTGLFTLTQFVEWYLIGYHIDMNPNDPSLIQDAAALLRRARQRSGLSARGLARRGGTSHATLLAYESGRKVPSVATFLRLLNASGHAVDIALTRRIRERDGISRGEELAQVLKLAGRFPARASRALDYPLLKHWVA